MVEFHKKRVLRQGNSFCVVLTKELKELGIVPDDEILVAVKRVPTNAIPKNEYGYAVFETGFDPSEIAAKIRRVADVETFEDDELRTLIRYYTSVPKEVDAVLWYLRTTDQEE